MIDPRLVVLHVVQSMNYGGMERVIADLITWTNPERFKLHLLCLEYLGRFKQRARKRGGVARCVANVRLLVRAPGWLGS